MKTAKEYLQDKYPSMRGDSWNMSAVDDDWVAKQMEEYASQKYMEDKAILVTYGEMDSDGNVYQKGCFGDSLDKMREKGYTVIENEPREVKR